MNKLEEALEMSDEKFLRRFGYSKKAMKKMAEILREAYSAKHKRRGRNSKLCVEEMLTLACKYWREYVTFFSLGNEYGAAESTAHDITVRVENVLIKSGEFGLPGKKTLERRRNRSYFSRRDGEQNRTPEEKTKTLVFE